MRCPDPPALPRGSRTPSEQQQRALPRRLQPQRGRVRAQLFNDSRYQIRHPGAWLRRRGVRLFEVAGGAEERPAGVLNLLILKLALGSGFPVSAQLSPRAHRDRSQLRHPLRRGRHNRL